MWRVSVHHHDAGKSRNKENLQFTGVFAGLPILIVVVYWLAVGLRAMTSRGPVLFILLCVFLVAPGFVGGGAIASATVNATDALIDGYRLGARDKVRVIVFEEAELSGEFVVDDSGFVRLPLIGQVEAAGRSVRQLERDIEARLASEYLRNPRVSIEVINYRPFYIIGEVNKPGEYSYVAGMRVLNAVALAGGYTSRANEDTIYVRRMGNSVEERVDVDEKTQILPGDIVRVAERWF